MPENKTTAGPMRTQPLAAASTVPTPVLPMMPMAGKVGHPPQPKKQPKPTRAEAVRVAKAKMTRRNSLQKQRDALKG
jgi:hypothetical protein